MSDVPAKEFGSGVYRLADQGTQPVRPAGGAALNPKVIDFKNKSSDRPAAAISARDRQSALPHVFGLLLVAGACLLGAISLSTWQTLVGWTDAPFTSESCRWVVVALMATTGVSFLQTRPIFFVITAAQGALAVCCMDVLLQGRLTKWVESAAGIGRAPAALAIAASMFGYLVYANPRARAPSIRGMLGLLIVAATALGVTRGWFTGTRLANRIGPSAVQIASAWGQEITWASVLVLTAIGVSLSRGRPGHLLTALLLAVMAFACVKAGYAREVTFPELSTPTNLIKIEHESYMNVDAWRWVVAAELVCLSTVLLHMSLGMGSLSIVFATAWMIIGLALYDSVGMMSLTHTLSEASGTVDPLANMGVPQNPTSFTVNTSKPIHVTKNGLSPAEEALIRQSVTRELTLSGWLMITALFAGVIAAAGLRMISEDRTYRLTVIFLLWLSFLLGIFVLAWIWPRDPTQSWEEWLAAFKFSRHHKYLFWLAFMGSTSFVGIWAVARSQRAAAWINAAIAAIFLGTATSLVGAAIMIRFGGFSPLPIWVYCIMAAVQSSLAWALLFHINAPARQPTNNARTASIRAG